MLRARESAKMRIPKVNVIKDIAFDTFGISRPIISFAYGSAVFPQSHTKNIKQDNMLDIILVVENSREFHVQNLSTNQWHYSNLSYLGADFLSQVQQNYGGKLYFNTDVSLKDNKDYTRLKYGVISYTDFLDDLMNWSSFYIAGRLQKPVLFLTDLNKEIKEVLSKNLSFAVSAALIRRKQNKDSPSFVSNKQLFESITELSYLGDIRMGIAENNHKILNIVEGSFENFVEIYRPILLADFNVDIAKTHGISLDVVNVDDLEQKLPAAMQQELLTQNIDQVLSRKIKKSSFEQTLKGIVTAGAFKSLAYAYRKVKKRIMSPR